MANQIRQYFIKILLLGTTSTFCDTLKAKYATAKLPIPLADSPTVYDGNDSVYLFGGHTSAPISKILRYSIDSDSIEELGQLPTALYRGSLHTVGTDIYYFGGYVLGGGYSDIVKLDTLTNSIKNVGELPFTASYQTSFKQHNSSVIYILKSNSITDGLSTLYKCDTSTLTVTAVDTNVGIIGYTSVTVDNYVYIYGDEGSGSAGRKRSRILTIDMESISSPAHSFTFNDRAFSLNSPAVSDGVNAYILDSYDSSIVPGFLADPFVQINLQGYNRDNPEIEDFPVPQSDSHYYRLKSWEKLLMEIEKEKGSQ